VRSAIPPLYCQVEHRGGKQSVIVNDTDTLIDPHRTGDINPLFEMIQERVISLPAVRCRPGELATWRRTRNAFPRAGGISDPGLWMNPVMTIARPVLGRRLKPRRQREYLYRQFPRKYGARWWRVEVNTARDSREAYTPGFCRAGALTLPGVRAGASTCGAKNTLAGNR